jgi:tetratricopeptide (TPR) repeat protein
MAKIYVKDYSARNDVIDKRLIIAQADIHLGRYQEAVDYLYETKLSADSEREPEIQYYIGEALLNAGRYEDAIAEFVKIPLLSKKTKLQWEASALYYSGQAYEKLGRIADAVRMYKEIIKRPGIDLILKKDAEKRIKQLKG